VATKEAVSVGSKSRGPATRRIYPVNAGPETVGIATRGGWRWWRSGGLGSGGRRSVAAVAAAAAAAVAVAVAATAPSSTTYRRASDREPLVNGEGGYSAWPATRRRAILSLSLSLSLSLCFSLSLAPHLGPAFRFNASRQI
jgi:hypothetical protein